MHGDGPVLELNLDMAASRAKMHTVDDRRFHITPIRHTKMAKAFDVPDKVTSAMLKDYLEDFQMGGQKGSVVRVHFTGQHVATITFCDEQGMAAALRHAS